MYDKEGTRQRLAFHVRRLRKLLGMTQPQLASAAGVVQSMISSIENGTVVANCIDMANIAEALNTTTESLMKPIPANELAEV